MAEKTENVIEIGGQAVDQAVVDPSVYVLEEVLYTTADGTVVRAGDPDAAYIYKGIGSELPVGEAEDLGLVEKPAPKKAAKPADKKRAPAENKSS